MTLSAGLSDFRLAYEISPIFFTGGIVQNGLPGGQLPLICITEAVNFDSLQHGALADKPLDSYFAHFKPLAGATLIENDLGRYPFANQAVAANAIIAEPLRLSMLMWCPAKEAGGYSQKLSIFQTLQAAFYQHGALGGTYTVATPSYFYTNLILLKFSDVTGDETKQAQSAWQLDFEQPLITQQQATEVQNTLMTRMSNLLRVTGDPPSYSGLDPTTGNPASGVTPSLIPAAQKAPAALGTSPGIQAPTGGPGSDGG